MQYADPPDHAAERLKKPAAGRYPEQILPNTAGEALPQAGMVYPVNDQDACKLKTE